MLSAARAALAALLALGSGNAHAGPGPGVSLETDVLWDGAGAFSAPTEFEVKVESPASGRAEVVVEGSGFAVSAWVSLRRGEPAALSLPVFREAGPLTISAQGPDGSRVRRPLAARRTRAGALIAVAGEVGAGLEREPSYQVVYPAASALPRHAASYQSLDALIVDQAALGRLDDSQSRALASYLGACGRVLLAGGDVAALAALRASAGCGGGYVQSSDAETIGSALAELLGRPRPQPLEAGALRPLLAAPGRGLGAGLGGTLIVYGAALAAGTLAAKRARWLAVLPFLGAALVWAAAAGAPRSSLVCWAEAGAGDSQARYTALLRVDGSGLGNAAVELRRGAALPRPLGQPARLRLDAGEEARGPIRATFDAPLFSQNEFELRGSLPLRQALEVRVDAAAVVVLNRSEVEAPACLLLWAGQAFAVPPLRAGQRWQPAEGSARRSLGAVEQLALARSRDLGPSLLLAHVPEWARHLGAASGWLLVAGRTPVAA